MFKCLPPVGSPVLSTPISNPKACFSTIFGNQNVLCYGSGTMALAAALIAAKKRKELNQSEVLLPAYSCPDLVSAAVYAGVKPVLVDLEPGKPWIDLNKLRGQITPRTIAVIAVHFLGITERLSQIREVLSGLDVLLIEDSAQLFPKAATAGIWEGDFIILSFGRGKPVSLLGGGAVICRDKSLLPNLPQAEEAILASKVASPTLKFVAKTSLYNQLLKPNWYTLLSLLPFLHLGETRYKPLTHLDIAGMDISSMLATNIEAYTKRDLRSQFEISTLIEELQCDEILDLPTKTSNNPSLPLLRYPLLINSPELRDTLFARLSEHGLGASKMYSTSLPAIEGLEDMFKNQGKFPEAKNFSQRLLTLPCHMKVSRSDIERIGDIIMQVIRH